MHFNWRSSQNLLNCRVENDLNSCVKCHNDFYLNVAEHLCHSNNDPNWFKRGVSNGEGAFVKNEKMIIILH